MRGKKSLHDTLVAADLTRPPDSALATATILLMAIGIVSVYSAGVMESETLFDSSGHYLTRQVVAALIGLGCMIITSKLPLRILEKLTTFFGLATLAVLVIVLIPGIGVYVGGARRWLRLGFVRFQPSEFAHLATVMLVSKYAASHADEIRTFKGLCKSLLLPTIFACLIMAEPDYDTALMVVLVGAIILFVAGIPWIYITLGGASGLAAAIALVVISPYRRDRIVGFLNPLSDPRGKGYHIIQSWTAMGSGGLFGKGLGGSVQKLGFLPEANTDFIFAVIGEEGGFLLTSLIVFLFIVIAWRGYKIAMAQTIPFAKYLAVGLTAMISLQGLLNMMVVTGLAPTTGVPLPLVSFGGTSLVFMTSSLGILWGLSRQCE